MTTKGIKIFDKKNEITCVDLPSILNEIYNGNLLNWSILHLLASGNLGGKKSILDLEKQIHESEKGLLISWDELKTLSDKFYEIIDILLIGSENISLLRRYRNDKEMYDSCDIVIEMVDSSYWEIFSKNEDQINRFTKKFKKIKHFTLG